MQTCYRPCDSRSGRLVQLCNKHDLTVLALADSDTRPCSQAPCHSSGFPPQRPGFEPRSGHVGFVVEKVVLGQIISEYWGFPCQFSFHRLLHTHHHLSSGAGTIGQLVADVPSGLSLTPPQGKEENAKGGRGGTYRLYFQVSE
jgi:hypothetical protein